MSSRCGISNKRYEQIKEIVADMYEDLGYTEIPVNVFELCHKLNIKLVKYSSLTKEQKECAMQLSPDGFSLRNNRTKQYEIYYNSEMPAKRITFTIMHEIAHIMLEHIYHSYENEQEANFFTKAALVPLGLIYRLQLKNPIEVAQTFGISMECAQNVVDHYNRSMKHPAILIKEANSRLVRLFYERIQEVV